MSANCHASIRLRFDACCEVYQGSNPVCCKIVTVSTIRNRRIGGALEMSIIIPPPAAAESDTTKHPTGALKRELTATKSPIKTVKSLRPRDVAQG
jgi:hypothetical protein